MHPGWADTPGLAKSMPGFYDRFKRSMRTTEEGADTIVWAACSKEVMGVLSGSFLLGEYGRLLDLPDFMFWLAGELFL